MIQSEAQLEDCLATPSEKDIAAFRRLDEDLVLLGVGGKIGPALAMRAGRAARAAGSKIRVIGTAVHCERLAVKAFEESGVEILSADLLNPAAVANLPDAANVIFLAGRKFGSTGNEGLTWAANVYMPALVAERYRDSRIVAFSSGNVYPFVPVSSGGATEETRPIPVGEYAQSVLGRERIFEHFSSQYGTPVALLRLNYAIDLRYGVLFDIASKVATGQSIDLTMGAVNVIWQGDVNSVTLRCLEHCQSPPFILNLTGPETLSVRSLAERFGSLLGTKPIFTGEESPTALLNNAARCRRMFGEPSVNIEEMLEWTAHWIKIGGRSLGKPTHFEARDGKF